MKTLLSKMYESIILQSFENWSGRDRDFPQRVAPEHINITTTEHVSYYLLRLASFMASALVWYMQLKTGTVERNQGSSIASILGQKFTMTDRSGRVCGNIVDSSPVWSDATAPAVTGDNRDLTRSRTGPPLSRTHPEKSTSDKNGHKSRLVDPSTPLVTPNERMPASAYVTSLISDSVLVT